MKAAVSRKLAEVLDTDDSVKTSDSRVPMYARAHVVPSEVMEAIEELFAGLPQNEQRTKAILDARSKVTQHWENATKSFLTIGRALNSLDRSLLTKEEKGRLKAGFERLFPFSEPIAAQFRKVAEMIDAGRLPLEQCPGSYSVAYQVALLAPDELVEAQRRGLINRATRRSVLVAFRRERALERPPQPQVSIEGLTSEYQRNQDRLNALQGEMARLTERQTEIKRLLEPDSL